MSKRDYYEILEVSRTASDGEISTSYRKLAIRYHPDSNPGDEEATAKFKEAAEAYEVLSDTNKRAMYDQHGHAAFAGGPGGGGGQRGGPQRAGLCDRHARRPPDRGDGEQP